MRVGILCLMQESNTFIETPTEYSHFEDDMILETSHPEFGTVRQAAGAIKVSDYRHEHSRGPKLGEHTEAVLGDWLAMGSAEIQGLRKAGVI